MQADKIFQEIEGHKHKIAHAEAVYAESKTANRSEGTRPTHKTGFLGLIGKKVDTIEYCNEQINGKYMIGTPGRLWSISLSS